MILKNSSVLLGKDLEYISSTNIQISNQKFKRIQKNIQRSAKEETFDCEGLLLIPGLINSHTHIGDSIAKDVTLHKSVDERIHPVFGVKPKVLKKTKPSQLASFMQNTCKSMIQKGITTFVDFREGGIEGVKILKKVLTKVPIRSIILGRIEYYQNSNQIKKNIDLPSEERAELSEILKKCDGIGVSGANENSNSVLRFYSRTQKLRAIHAAETKGSVNVLKRMTRKSEVIRALQLKPHFLIHMTQASKSELFLASKKTRGIVICPRANASLAEGIPNLQMMLQTRCNIAIGTDNVMINSPDMFREMDYLWKVSMATSKKRIDPKQILKMATVNAGKLLQKGIGTIERGKLADCVLINKHSIDLEPMLSPHASIVHRASENAIRAVIIGGKIVHGKI
ncbi:MAG: pyrimidine deaminase archaeal predicted [Marine Group I thaumarchaeote]|nr:MAG: pyrimidine deaminase archaeal predicted [Marine Group I thaumarchaeote]